MRYILVVFLLLLAFSGVLALFSGQPSPSTEISLSQLVQKINQGQVKEIVVRGDTLAVAGEAENWRARREPSVSVSESLSNLGAGRDKLSAVGLTAA